MDVYLLIGLALFAVMVASVVVVGAAERRGRTIADADERHRRATDELREIDEIIEGIGALPIPDAFRDLLRRRRAKLADGIDPRFVPRVPEALDTTAPRAFATSQVALKNMLGDLKGARRYLRELERSGQLSNTDRMPMTQKLSALSVSVQAESFVAWSEMPGVDANAMDAYLRDAQEVLSKSLHVDRGFAARVAELKERQELLAGERLQRAREEAEVRAAAERRAQQQANGGADFNEAAGRA